MSELNKAAAEGPGAGQPDKQPDPVPVDAYGAGTTKPWSLDEDDDEVL